MEQNLQLEELRTRVRGSLVEFRNAIADLIEAEPIENIDGIFDRAFPDCMPLNERGAMLSAFNSGVALLTIAARREAVMEGNNYAMA